MEDFEEYPFANMMIQKHQEIPEAYQQTAVQNTQHLPVFDANFEIKQEPDNYQPNMNTENPHHDIKLDDDSYDDLDSYLDHSAPLNDDNFGSQGEFLSPTEATSEDTQKKIRGRPKGAKNGTGRRSKFNMPPPLSLKGDRLPKMHINLHRLEISPEQVEELKKLPCFFQQGVCFKIAPDLDKCKECWKRIDKRFQLKGTVECRFFQFRKLRYNGDNLEVAGFLDPDADPVDIDRNIWLPSSERRFKSLSLQNARLIMTHVGDCICDLIEKEKIYYQKYKSDEKPIIWKRLIDGVIEICDQCSTTLFNFHFICTKCGLSLCVDCVSESKEGKFKISCSNRESEGHCFEDLSLTQIIVGDCAQKLQTLFHEYCVLWNIDHHCKFMDAKPAVDQGTLNLARNLLVESETGKSVIGRELQHRSAVIEVDFSKVKTEAPQGMENFDEAFDDFFNRNRKNSHTAAHCKPVKNCNSVGRECVVSISRSMSQATSDMLYPDCPHRWLCENKLLRLLEPMNPRNESFFHEQWQRGQPVLVSNVLEHLNQELWIPQAFSAEFGHERSDLINCMTGNLVRNREISVFWDGFENVEKRLQDNEGKPMLLKLKDWPPDSDFKNKMPSRFDDLMKNLPLNVYANRSGDLNIVKYLPSCFIHPDLGPKGYFAYGSPYYLKEGTTNLHLDVSDAINVMCYIGFPRDKNKSFDEYIQQGFKALLEADCDLANINRVIEDGEIPGAIWHIYEACDAERIRDFLLKIAQERGFQVADDHDVIHDQNWYLDGELRARLFKEYGVKGYAIAQCLGDCVILPAGTPHQVRNIFSCIKIAEDFVSPQQVAHCINLSNQFRKLTKTHTNNEEKLNIRNVAYHSVKESIATLTSLMARRTHYNKPHEA